jgi:hypothetical protein
MKNDTEGKHAPPPVLDPQIRAALMDWLASDDPDAIVFHELPLARGNGRADVVAVNGVISGYEIKSERDSLIRLVGQIENYSGVCEFMTVIVAKRHLRHARTTVPRRWGIVVADVGRTGVELRPIRKPQRNANLDKSALIRLMWRSECSRALRNNGVQMPRNALALHLWRELEKFPLRRLLYEVRSALKRRAGLEPAESQTRDDG